MGDICDKRTGKGDKCGVVRRSGHSGASAAGAGDAAVAGAGCVAAAGGGAGQTGGGWGNCAGRTAEQDAEVLGFWRTGTAEPEAEAGCFWGTWCFWGRVGREHILVELSHAGRAVNIELRECWGRECWGREDCMDCV